jgi:cysteine/O-acetylserine efflux protein
MTINLFAVISYVLISSFTPGPANISSASTAVIHGYKKTLNYLAGLSAGVFFIMILSGWFSKTLLNIFPALEPIMRYAGAAYILYLAFGILKASYSFAEEDVKSPRFVNGFTLQILNPKLIVYAFTLFSAFLAPLTTNIVYLISAATVLAGVSFCATSTWAIFGTAIKNYLHNPRLKTAINVLLALSLVYTAITLIGLV